MEYIANIISCEMIAAAPVRRSKPALAAILTKAVLRAAQHLDIPSKVLARVIGVSEATVSRLRSGQSRIEPSDKAFELAALFVRLYRSLDAITGGDDSVSARWLQNHNTALHVKPVEAIQTVQGLVGVIQYLDSRRAVV
jgi:transcriptional regulator with XRE-family HTH domain